MSTVDESREIILDHYQNPRNHVLLDQPTIANRGKNPLCGDEIELSLGMAEDGLHIDRVGFAGRGCSISQASASMMTEMIRGLTVDEAALRATEFSQKMASKTPPPAELEEEIDALEGVKKYPARVKCALLAWTTLREAVDMYRTSQQRDRD